MIDHVCAVDMTDVRLLAALFQTLSFIHCVAWYCGPLGPVVGVLLQDSVCETLCGIVSELVRPATVSDTLQQNGHIECIRPSVDHERLEDSNSIALGFYSWVALWVSVRVDALVLAFAAGRCSKVGSGQGPGACRCVVKDVSLSSSLVTACPPGTLGTTATANGVLSEGTMDSGQLAAMTFGGDVCTLSSVRNGFLAPRHRGAKCVPMETPKVGPLAFSVAQCFFFLGLLLRFGIKHIKYGRAKHPYNTQCVDQHCLLRKAHIFFKKKNRCCCGVVA